MKNKSVASSVSVDDSGNPGSTSSFDQLSTELNAQTELFQAFLNTPGSSLSSTGSGTNTTREERFGGVYQIIEPFSEREQSELINAGLSVKEEDQSVFFAEQAVSELFEDLPLIIGQDTDDKFTIAEDESEFPASDENGSTEQFNLSELEPNSILTDEKEDSIF
ncbi:MAG: hypothetical protein ABEK50_08555 [bacterium]